MGEQKRVLIIGATNTPAILGCGAAIVRLLESGARIRLICGLGTSCGKIGVSQEDFRRQRGEEREALDVELNKIAQEAGNGGSFEAIYLGKDRNTSDQMPGNYNQESLFQDLFPSIREFEPNICFVPSLISANKDDIDMAKAALNVIPRVPGWWFPMFGEKTDPETGKPNIKGSGLVLQYETAPKYFSDPTMVQKFSEEELEVKRHIIELLPTQRNQASQFLARAKSMYNQENFMLIKLEGFLDLLLK